MYKYIYIVYRCADFPEVLGKDGRIRIRYVNKLCLMLPTKNNKQNKKTVLSAMLLLESIQNVVGIRNPFML